MKFIRDWVSFIDRCCEIKIDEQKKKQEIMNRLIIPVISLNYLEDKINGFHVTTRQRQINHLSELRTFFQRQA